MRYSDNSWEYKERPISRGIMFALLAALVVLGGVYLLVKSDEGKCLKSHYEHHYYSMRTVPVPHYVEVEGGYECDQWGKTS